MSLTKRVSLFAGAATLTLTGVGLGDSATDTGNEDLRARLAATEARLAELENNQTNQKLTEERASEIRGLISDVLADADTRASLLQSGGTAGHDDGGFFLSSADGNFLLNISGQEQVRFVYNHRDDAGIMVDGDVDSDIDSAILEAFNDTFGGGFDSIDDIFNEDDNRSGFENRRTRLVFSGHIVNPQWIYKIQGGFDRNGGDFRLLDAWIGYDYADSGFTVYAGQFKSPLLREELVSSKRQLAVERSIVNEFFTADRVQGILLEYWNPDNTLHLAGSFNDGVRSSNTGWDGFDTEYAFSGRAEYIVSGNAEQFRDFTSFKGEETGVMIGAAGHYQEGEFGTSAEEFETFIATADVSAEFGGANLFAAAMIQEISSDIDNENLGDIFDNNPFGFIVQGGFFLNEDWELYGRFEYLDYDSDVFDELQVVTAGVNKYLPRHNAKWTTDVGYSFGPVVDFTGGDTGFTTDGIDVDISPEGDLDLNAQDGQFVVRTQFQLLF